MGRPRKTTLKAVAPPQVEELKASEFPVVVFGDQKFEIHPIADRDDDFAYEDSARFLTLAIPVGSRVFSEILKMGADNEAAISRVRNAQVTGEDQATVIIDLLGMVAEMKVGELLDDVSDTLPKLAAIACHYTDPDVTEREIKRWCKSPLNPVLWRAVIAQFTADRVLQQVAGLRELMGEFGQSA